jgi:hypothetical protein
MSDTHPFLLLRRAIRQSGAQYRANGDNSESIFHPVSGFRYAYDIHKVEEALDAYELTLDTEFQEEKPMLTVEEEITIRGTRLSEMHDSMEVRDFARYVLAYMAKHNKGEEVLA